MSGARLKVIAARLPEFVSLPLSELHYQQLHVPAWPSSLLDGLGRDSGWAETLQSQVVRLRENEVPCRFTGRLHVQPSQSSQQHEAPLTATAVEPLVCLGDLDNPSCNKESHNGQSLHHAHLHVRLVY